jgi:hypothetical protein
MRNEHLVEYKGSDCISIGKAEMTLDQMFSSLFIKVIPMSGTFDKERGMFTKKSHTVSRYIPQERIVSIIPNVEIVYESLKTED